MEPVPECGCVHAGPIDLWFNTLCYDRCRACGTIRHDTATLLDASHSLQNLPAEIGDSERAFHRLIEHGLLDNLGWRRPLTITVFVSGQGLQQQTMRIVPYRHGSPLTVLLCGRRPDKSSVAKRCSQVLCPTAGISKQDHPRPVADPTLARAKLAIGQHVVPH